MDHIIWTMIFSWISLKHYNLANVKYYDVNKKLNQRLRDARKLSDDWESKFLHAISFQLKEKLLILESYFSIHCTNRTDVRHYAGRRISALSYESSFEVRYFHHFIRAFMSFSDISGIVGFLVGVSVVQLGLSCCDCVHNFIFRRGEAKRRMGIVRLLWYNIFDYMIFVTYRMTKSNVNKTIANKIVNISDRFSVQNLSYRFCSECKH